MKDPQRDENNPMINQSIQLIFVRVNGLIWQGMLLSGL
jgi:hypothetical protein